MNTISRTKLSGSPRIPTRDRPIMLFLVFLPIIFHIRFNSLYCNIIGSIGSKVKYGGHAYVHMGGYKRMVVLKLAFAAWVR